MPKVVFIELRRVTVNSENPDENDGPWSNANPRNCYEAPLKGNPGPVHPEQEKRKTCRHAMAGYCSKNIN